MPDTADISSAAEPDLLADGPTMTVLLVEDDPPTQMMVVAEMEGHGIHVDIVDTLWDAVQTLTLSPSTYRCVIADLTLPDSSGYESVVSLLGTTSNPLVVFSGGVDEELGLRLRRAGAAAVVDKSAGTSELREAVTQATHAWGLDLEVMPEASMAVSTSTDHQQIVADCLAFLDEHIPMGTWMFTRVRGNDWIVLGAVGDRYGIKQGDVLRWSDSFCSRMVQGEGPRVTTDAMDLDVYRRAPVAQQLPIRTYVGMPLALEGTGLFGTLCGISPDELDLPLEVLEPFVRKIAELLTAIVGLSMQQEQLRRRLDLATAASTTDHLSGLPNRRAFELMLRVEEARCRRFGSTACLLVVDLNGLKATNDQQGHAAGDRLIAVTGRVLAQQLRASDMAFRIGGDEFAIIAPRCDEAEVAVVTERLRTELDDAGISVAIGAAIRETAGSMDDALQRADQRMYEDKLSQQSG